MQGLLNEQGTQQKMETLCIFHRGIRCQVALLAGENKGWARCCGMDNSSSFLGKHDFLRKNFSLRSRHAFTRKSFGQTQWGSQALEKIPYLAVRIFLKKSPHFAVCLRVHLLLNLFFEKSIWLNLVKTVTLQNNGIIQFTWMSLHPIFRSIYPTKPKAWMWSLFSYFSMRKVSTPTFVKPWLVFDIKIQFKNIWLIQYRPK